MNNYVHDLKSKITYFIQVYILFKKKPKGSFFVKGKTKSMFGSYGINRVNKK